MPGEPRPAAGGRPLAAPAAVYAFIEIGIGAAGLAVLWGMPYLDRFYAAYGGQGIDGIILRPPSARSACCRPPSSWARRSRRSRGPSPATRRAASGGSGPYGGNIAGGVFGCLAAGFYLLRVHDMAVATYAAAAVNAVAGITAFVLAARQSYVLPSVMMRGAAHLTSTGAIGCRQAAREFAPLARAGYRQPMAPDRGHPTDSPEPPLDEAPKPPALPGPRRVRRDRAVGPVRRSGPRSSGRACCRSCSGRRSTRSRSSWRSSSSGSASAGARGGCWREGIPAARGPRVVPTAARLAVAWTAYAVARSLPYWTAYAKASDSTLAGFGRDLRGARAVGPPTVLWGASFPLALAAAAASSAARPRPRRRRGARGQHARRDRRVARLRHARRSPGSARTGPSGCSSALSPGRARGVRTRPLERAKHPTRTATRERRRCRAAASRRRPRRGTRCRRCDRRRGADPVRAPRPRPARRLRPARAGRAQPGRRAAVPLRRRGRERLGRRDAVRRRRAELPRQRQGRGLQRAAGHAPPADARPPPRPDPPAPAVGAGRRVRRGGDGGVVHPAPGGRADRHLRDRAAHPAGRRRALRVREPPRPARPARRRSSTTTPATSC